MKICKHCNCINFNKALKCRCCETEFSKDDPIVKPQTSILLRKKIIFWLAAWITTAIAMTIGSWNCWLMFWDFPFFTPFAFLVAQFQHAVSFSMVIISGWLYYVVITIWGFYQKQRRSFFIVFVILCISLLLNIAGCQSVLHMQGHF
jgi:hypothetical protein